MLDGCGRVLKEILKFLMRSGCLFSIQIEEVHHTKKKKIRY
uniref:Uncharacterized protein n=1 Tax=Nelumbo nucifera TaxID=4432 RepID=A0A822YLG6_NELNU|nr:TPA_asm: hypothetical protein HUJ06_010597 [Nelumbo nucifera]